MDSLTLPPDAPQRLALALAIGFLVGVERGWRARDVAEGGRTAGIRTYALTGLLGGVAGLLSLPLGGWAFAALALPFAAAFIFWKQREQAADGDRSVTAVVAALLVFALGANAVLGSVRLSAAAAVVATGLLAFKRVLHDWIRRLIWPELRGALILLAMTFVALPLLPDRGFGPADSLNPHEIWLLTIALAGVSFAAYAAVRVFGAARGLLVASAAGALVSSTAVTLNLARTARREPGVLNVAAASALVAGTVMAVRVGAISAVVAPATLKTLAAPLAAFAASSAAIAGMSLRSRGAENAAGPPPLKSPLDLTAVLKFGALLGLILALTRIAGAVYGARGLLPTAALAGLADVDAVALAVGRMTSREGLAPALAASAVLLAVAMDSAGKICAGALIAGRGFARRFGAGTLAALATAGLAYTLQRHWAG